MEISKLQKRVKEIVKEVEPFVKITAEQVAEKLIMFCEENDIEKNTDEFDIIMNYGNFYNSFMFEFQLTFEKLKQQTKGQINPLDID